MDIIVISQKMTLMPGSKTPVLRLAKNGHAAFAMTIGRIRYPADAMEMTIIGGIIPGSSADFLNA
jgi:hypothetical protein